ncbi:MAG: TonB-dependent receptor plug domain-containing protein [Planctomycetota bacterium]|jgi:iron complex outermembrane receptor protein
MLSATNKLMQQTIIASRRFRRFISYFLISTIFVIPITAVAQNETTIPQHNYANANTNKIDPDRSTEELDDIDLLQLEIPTIVTATRREQKITNLPYAISVITAEDIRLSGARSIPDALRLVPGVDVAELAYGNTALSPRGLHGYYSNNVLVLVDGRQVYDAFFGGTLWGAWPFQLEDIERIEVIRGPGGVTWGANATNGVINIITKDPADQLGLTLTAGGGSRGMHKEHLGYAFAEDKLRLRISGEYEASDGFKKGGNLLANINDSYMSGRIALHGIYEAGPHDKVTFSAGSAMVDNGYPLPPIPPSKPQNAGTQANFFLSKWHHQFKTDNYFELTGYVNDFFFDAGFGVFNLRYQQIGLLFSHTFKPSEEHVITWGLDNRVDLFDATPADPRLLSKDHVHSNAIGLYLQDGWQFAPKLTLNLGGRIDYDSYGGFQPSGRIALAYELSEHSNIYGAVSRAYRMQTAPIRFMDTPLLGGLAAVTTDRDVKSTCLMAYEVGYRGQLFNKLDYNLNLFWHENSDMFGLTAGLGPPGLIHINIDSVGSYSVYGLEFDAKYNITDNLTLLGNYTFQQSRYSGTLSYTQALDLIVPPKHKFMVGARYSPFEDLHLSAHLYYVDTATSPDPGFPLLPTRVDPYFRLDLRSEFEFWEDKASIAVGVRNLLDENHPEGADLFLNDAEVPRMVYAEFRLNIK